ncbi:FAD-dependent monooxygenase [Roseicyclus persicicus]|uniref:NAD(P)-binding protein n=1 Tax=Roseicyclus persicicus TaxID=2650661 RepID=A0A7X6GX58_9RHOB|nr:FAD-dependent monooxygenase [Roseibacterium persicicum]NKX43938.1 NAD(P)-binding protein [Roseibacterium persicicum]
MLIGQEITVIGGGIGGLAAALALARRGAAVTVLEQAPAITEVGAGIQISPNGWRVLQALGVAEAVAATSPRSQAVRLRDFRRGAEVFAMPLSRPDQPWHLVHRADLVAALAGAAAEAGVALRLGTRVAAVEPGPMGTALRLADGTTETHGLTIAADGLHSPARAALNPKSRAFFTGQVAWRCTIPADTPLAPEAHVFMGPGRHLVRYPLRDRRLVNVVAVEERDGWAAEGWHHRDDPRHLARAFTDFCPEVGDLLAQATEVYLWGLFRHPVAPVWHDPRLALLGDAAHPTLPFLAQGANMALEDAYVLARCLAEDPDTRAGLARYAALRRPRCARIVQAATDNATNYHLRPGPLRFAAHSALRLAQRVAPHAVAAKFDWVHRHDVTA